MAEYDNEFTMYLEPEGNCIYYDYVDIKKESIRTSAKKVIVSEKVTIIEECAFSYYREMEEIELPSSICWIGERAFEACSNLKRIEIPYGVEEIPAATFSGCYKLEEVVIPSSVSEIGCYAFWACYELKEIVLPEGIRTIAAGAFCECTSLKQVLISSTLTILGEDVFRHCDNLEKIFVPAKVWQNKQIIDRLTMETNAELVLVSESEALNMLMKSNISKKTSVQKTNETCTAKPETVKQTTSIKSYSGVMKASMITHRKKQAKGYFGYLKK